MTNFVTNNSIAIYRKLKKKGLPSCVVLPKEVLLTTAIITITTPTAHPGRPLGLVAPAEVKCAWFSSIYCAPAPSMVMK